MPELDMGLLYDFAFIRDNPIAAVCVRCGKQEPINAPTLENVRCFWCSVGATRRGFVESEMRPLDPASSATKKALRIEWREENRAGKDL